MKKERIMLRRETGRKIPVFKVLFVTVLVSVIALLAILVAVIAKAPEISAAAGRILISRSGRSP